MRLVALVESADHVCCRYRIAPFRAAFARAGFTLDVTPLPRSRSECLRLFRSFSSADAVVVQRLLLPPFLLAALRQNARYLIYDFDDAVWLRDSYSPKGLESRKRLGRFRAITASADRVVAGNQFLAEAISATPATVIPTCVDPSRYSYAHHTGAGTTLVWIGSQSTLRGLDRFRPTLEAIGRAIPGIRLRLIGDKGLSFEHLPVELVPWTADREAAVLAESDIGIAWVPDDAWSRGKCGLKILQYQAAGLPVLANPVGVHAEMVSNDVTGYLANSAADWVWAIQRLAADRDLRRKLGAAGRAQVDSRYGVAAGARLWADVLAHVRRPLSAAG